MSKSNKLQSISEMLADVAKDIEDVEEVTSVYKVEDPRLIETLSADSRGRVSLGREYANRDVKIVVAKVSDDGS